MTARSPRHGSTENAGQENDRPYRSKTDRHDWTMKDQISRVGKCETGKCGTNFTALSELKKTQKNVLCIVVLHFYSFLLQCTDYFLTAVVIFAFNWCIIN